MKVNQLKASGKPPQEIAALLGVPVEAVTAVTDQAQPQNHGGSEQQLETGEFWMDELLKHLQNQCSS